MTPKRAAVIALLLFVLATPGLVGQGWAAAIPTYFEDEWVGFACLTAFPPPGATATPLLLQLNFDKIVLGGIPLARADSLFSYFINNLGLLSPTIGKNPQVICTLSPSQTAARFPTDNALTAARQLSGTFQQIEVQPRFQRYVIFDVFLNFAPLYSGPVPVVEGDVFTVAGNDNISFAGNISLPDASLP